MFLFSPNVLAWWCLTEISKILTEFINQLRETPVLTTDTRSKSVLVIPHSFVPLERETWDLDYPYIP